jgi:CHAT domain-containing protein/Tfp pilus assembly protein PilF
MHGRVRGGRRAGKTNEDCCMRLLTALTYVLGVLLALLVLHSVTAQEHVLMTQPVVPDASLALSDLQWQKQADGALFLPVSQDIAQALYGEQYRESKAEQLYSDGKDAAAKGAYQEALRSFEQVLQIFTLRDNHRGRAAVLRMIGILHVSLGELTEALQAFQQTLNIAQTLEDDESEMIARANLGGVHSLLGQADQALAFYKEARTIAHKLGARAEEGDLLTSIGAVLVDLGQATQALKVSGEALQIVRELKDQARERTVLTNIGAAYVGLGQADQALAFYKEARAIAQKLGAQAEEGAILTTIGEVYGTVGQYTEAMAALQDALTLHERLGNHEDYAKTLNEIGTVYARLGQHDHALTLFHQALELSRRLGDYQGEGSILGNIGGVYSALNQDGQALQFYQQAYKLYQTRGDRRGEGIILSHMGRVYGILRQDAQALAMSQQAVAIHMAFGDRWRAGNALNNIGLVYGLLGQDTQALEAFQQALAIYKDLDDPEECWRSNAGSALALHALRRYHEALPHYETAVRIIETLRGNLWSASIKIGFFEEKLTVYRALVTLLLTLHQEAPTYGYDRSAFEYAERGKARAFLDQLTEARAKIRKGNDPELLAQEERLYRQLADVRKSLWEVRSFAQQRLLRKRTAALEHALTTLQQTLYAHNPRYATLHHPRPLSLPEVQGTLLQEGEILLEYFWGLNVLHLFIIDRTRLHTLTLPVQEHSLTDTVTHFLAALRSPTQPADFWAQLTPLHRLDLRDAYTLYQALIQPAKVYLPQAATLLIVPDGVLHSFPFELLVMEPPVTPPNTQELFADYRGAAYLVQDYPIVYAPSASVLYTDEVRQPWRQLPSTKTLLALAPFGPENRLSLPQWLRAWMQIVLGRTHETAEKVQALPTQPLPGSRDEVQNLGRLFHPKATILRGPQATKAALRAQARPYRYVHIATHGLVNETHSMYVGLVLANGEVLQTYEIFDLELQADVVTLSACETGLGPLHRGEGLVGLTRAFMYAGASSVVASLWPVNDASTAALMAAFYRHLRDGMPKAAALRQAKLAVMRLQGVGQDPSGRTITISYAHPYFWAPFVLSGGGR